MFQAPVEAHWPMKLLLASLTRGQVSSTSCKWGNRKHETHLRATATATLTATGGSAERLHRRWMVCTAMPTSARNAARCSALSFSTADWTCERDTQQDQMHPQCVRYNRRDDHDVRSVTTVLTGLALVTAYA